MPIVESELAPLRDARMAAQLAERALSPSPVWLWSADGSRMLFANAVGAAIFGAADAAERERRRFAAKDHPAGEIVRLAATLPASGQPRLERLRGFGAGFGRALTCACSRVVCDDGRTAVLIAATEPAGPSLPLSERVRRLCFDRGQALAAFAADGTLLYATTAAATRLGGVAALSALGIDALATRALASGSASGTTRHGPVEIERFGSDAATALVLSFGAQAMETPAATPAVEERQTIAARPAEATSPPAVPTPAVSAPPAPPEVATPVSTAAAKPPAAPTETAAVDEPSAERRYPLRFVWQMDADGRFVVGSDEFIELVGPRTTAACGRLWNEITTTLGLDPDNQVTRAVATRETFSGIIISWPVDDSSERLPVEFSGLPVFDREHIFRGYRGFGVCRDLARINQLARARRRRPLGFAARPERVEEEEAKSPPPPVVVVVEPAEAVVPPAAPEAVAPPAAAEAPLRTERPVAATAPAAANVVPFRSGSASEAKPPSLSPVERKAFRELAQELNARLRGAPQALEAETAVGAKDLSVEAPAADGEPAAVAVVPPSAVEAAESIVPAAPAVAAVPPEAPPLPEGSAPSERAPQHPLSETAPVLLERIPLGVLIYRDGLLLYANRLLLEWSGYDNIEALGAAGGLEALPVAPGAGVLAEDGSAQQLSIVTRLGGHLPVEGRLLSVPWSGGSALALVLASAEAEQRRRADARALAAAENDIRELKTMLEAAADGAFVLDREGKIVAATGGAEALFGRVAGEFCGRFFGEFLTAESEHAARHYFARVAQAVAHPSDITEDLRRQGTTRDGLVVTARRHAGEIVPLVLTVIALGSERFCAILRDATALQKLEEETRAAKREAQRATTAKAEFLAKISHEMRTPLNAITGFAEVIMAERFGPVANERYREYLKDIHSAGMHIVALLNDLLDLSKVETGQLDLNFGNVSLNDLTQQCVGIMQPQASRARIIIRTSLTPGLPQVIADERSLRQIVLNLLSNSIRFTGPGGQVIVSTAFADSGEAVLRVRDTGVGMSEKDVEMAMAPFRQSATSASWGSGGSGLGLPLTKALAEANRAHFSIKSAPNAGTLIEVAFPPTRVVAQ